MSKAKLRFAAMLLAAGASACGGAGGGGGSGGSSGDTTPPAVASTSPGGSSVVDVGAPITLTFSEAMSRPSVEAAVSISPALTCLWAWTSDSLSASCVHLSPLPHSTHYSVTVGTGATDAAGNHLAAPFSFAFDSAPPPDTTPPTVTAIAPADGSGAVPVDTAISVTFSEPMNQTSVQIALAPSADLGLGTWSADSLTVSYAPPAPLAYATAYTLSVGASDNAGNALAGPKAFAFTTEPQPLPPNVVSATPAAGTAAAPASTNISLSFDQPMDRTSVETAFSVSPAVTCAWGWSTDSTLATCTHADFAFDQDYTMTLGTGAMGQNGLFLAAAYSASFHTAAAPDTTPPVVCPSSGGTAPCPASATTAPAAAATGIATSSNIVVQFSEPMDKASAQTAFAIVSPSGHNAGVFSWNAAGDEMTYNPDVDFTKNDSVTWTVSTAATDLAGNPLAQAFSSSFLVIRSGTTTLTSVAALDGWATSTSSLASTGGIPVGDQVGMVWRAFLAFDLGGLPANLTAITSASLTAYQFYLSGDPYAAYGVLSAESVDFGTSLEAADWSTPVLTYLGKCLPPRIPCPNYVQDYVTLSTDGTIGYKTVDVTGKVIRDWAVRSSRANRCQFRLNFRGLAASTGATNVVSFYSADNSSGQPQLTVTYDYP